jgi:hypothetical protein
MNATPTRIALLAGAVLLLAGIAPAADKDAEGSKDKPAEAKPTSNLDYWLNQAKPVEEEDDKPAKPESGGRNPFRKSAGAFHRRDALPGVIELSDGRQLPGGLYTTREKPWIVWNEATKSWRRIPFINCLSITAVVEQERMELRWRWKGMGEPERVYTGKKYPLRRLHWRFKLIDGSVVEGATKGQPVFVELRGKTTGPFVLHERMKGSDGETLEDLVYIRKIVVSRKMMNAVIEDVEKRFAADEQADSED